ncbi:dATP/dGTP diphosphohydrolase domain-containing protein [Bradyrhizobium sp. PMVTL-01]|uniref:dATP/dGTP diphosphohydrolase domain-containing protein n=1 Tax=Bradyrhizobium sp. PMVTL-01 TaxID=3434999 RepID=UPI003F6FB631
MKVVSGLVQQKQKQEAGSKFDAGKARIDLIAPEMLFGTAEILTFGAEKYGERNWEKGMSWSRPFGALMRHLWAWWRGEKNDAETGKPHLWHASCCLMFLIAFEARSEGTDDRPRKITS